VKSTLFKTKLYHPPVRPELVSRPHLMTRLDEGCNGKLTVVSAPAGYGKTTLVSAWAAACKCPVAWLSLDEEDNDPARFLTYVVAAVQTIAPNLGQDILSVLQSAQPPAIVNLLPGLINQLDDMRAQFVLVLDDYHIITAPEIHKAITSIIDHQPPHMHITITTRIDPPLPLAHLRGRGQLTELRQADLRFSEEETVTFLKQGSGIELPSKDVNVLVNRTEGWIASLQMAALSMRSKKDISAFIAGFGGSHAYIVDYFASEILTNLSEPVRLFLLKTSFLDQLCGSLCNAVTGQTDGQQMLEKLQNENLFLVPLDDEQIWYRYHQLFADLLQKSLIQDYPAELPEFHLRASQWFEKNEYPHQAVEHAFKACDYTRAARLLEEAAEPVLGRGEHIWLLRWIEKLPEDQMEAHLRLGIVRAVIFVSTGFVQKAEGALLWIETQLHSQVLELPAQDYVIGRVAALHAMIAIQRGDVENVKHNAHIALWKLTKGTQRDAPWRAETLLALGLSNYAEGDMVEARQNLKIAIEDANLAGNPFTFLEVTSYLVEVLWIQGHLKEAVEICQEGLKFIDKNKLGSAPMSGQVFLGHCLLLCERCDLSQAEDFLNRGTELARSEGVALVLAWACYVKMRYLIAKGDLLAAENAAGEADHLPQLSELPLRVASGISALRALVWVRMGKLAEAEQYLRKRGIWSDSKIRYSYQREYLSLAALLIAKGDFVSAGELLDRVIEWAKTTQQVRTLICAHALHSMAFAAQKEMQKALKSLAIAMELAEPEGYLLTILELGESIAPLLYEAVQQGIHPECASQLFEAIKQTHPDHLEKTETQKKQPGILTPLRTREIEVLKLVADGRTNKEIANQLRISLRTVKFHMTCIFTKLEVDNRLQAVTKAKILGILS
jgi:LuxR family transcriptional regulator, maltose regulon positive regulatory protein